jgi:hypothetical protein
VLLRPSQRPSIYDARIVATYLAGTSTGALLTAIVAWLLSGFTEALSDASRLIALAAAGCFAWLCKHGPLDGIVALPEARRQIPAHVFGGSLTRGAYRFGFELATGVRTHVPSAAPYVLLLTVLLIRPTLAEALLMGLGFGVGRAVPLMVRLVHRGESDGRAFLRREGLATQTAATLLVLMGGLSLG